MFKRQICIRTYDYGKNVAELNELLNCGYIVIMCNQIGDCLEYIIEKEYKIEDESEDA